MKRIAFYGGSFDPPHNGHFEISGALTDIFDLDFFSFVPAFQAPHKRDRRTASPFHRFAMLALATNEIARSRVSEIELKAPERPFTIETLSSLIRQFPDRAIFFVMGADSWAEITTWREWERVLTVVNIIVVTRPGFSIETGHVTTEIAARVKDLRGKDTRSIEIGRQQNIYFTDSVQADVSSSKIRQMVKDSNPRWKTFVPAEVAKYIEKYELYRY